MIEGANARETNCIDDVDYFAICLREQLHRPNHPRPTGKLAPRHPGFLAEAAS
jgi:hypothetical protein